MKKILITGANGMIGSAIVQEMINKYQLILVDAYTNRIEKYLGQATVIKKDLIKVSEWQDMLDSVYCVVHLAAAVHWVPRTKEEQLQFVKTNAMGTKILYKACVEHGVERFLFFSTNDVYRASDKLITEETVAAPKGIYGASKFLAEEYLREVSLKSKTAVCIFRPASVYGENDNGIMKSLVELCKKGIVPMIGKGENKKALLYLKDIVKAVECYITGENGLNGEIFNIASGNYEYKKIIETICNSYRLKPIRVYIPAWFCRRIASKISPLKKLAVAGEVKAVSNDKAFKMLCYAGKYSLEEGLADAKDYYMGFSASSSKQK